MTLNFIKPLESNTIVFITRRDIEAQVFVLNKNKTQVRRNIRHSSVQNPRYIARPFNPFFRAYFDMTSSKFAVMYDAAIISVLEDQSSALANAKMHHYRVFARTN